LRRLGSATIVFALAFVVYIATVPRTAQALFQTIVNSSEDASVLARISQYARVGAIFDAQPFFGTGLGSINIAEYGPIDNQWLFAMAEGGLLGVAALSVLVVGGVFGIAHALRRTTTTRNKSEVYAMAAMFLAILSDSITFDFFNRDQILLVFFLLFGLLWANCTDTQSKSPSRREEPDNHLPVLEPS
jgi:O-antigen ligase